MHQLVGFVGGQGFGLKRDNGLRTKAVSKSKGLSHAGFGYWHTERSSVIGMTASDIRALHEEEGWLCSYFSGC